MLSVNIDYNGQDSNKGNNGQLKDVAGLNGSPISVMPGFPDLEDQFNQMGITHIRLHDIYGVGDLDNGATPGAQNNNDQMIPNVPQGQAARARNFIANFGNYRAIYPNAAIGMSQGNYDLAFSDANYEITDSYIRRIMNNNPAVNPQGINREIMFRIGRTIDGGYEVPADFDIYVTLVSTLIERYSSNIGMSGIPRKVAYWEIWNEPDLPFFWNNNVPDRYYDFYSKIAWKIKEVDPNAKLGGAGVANGYNPGSAYLDGLMSFCRNNNVPFDFISWHYYGNNTVDPQNIIDIANNIDGALRRYGYNNAESLCTEWNSVPQASINTYTKVQSARNASYIASSLIYMQSCKVDRAYYYRGDALSFGLFNDNPNPADTRFKSFCTYAAQAFALFNQLKQTPTLLNSTNTDDTGISVLAGKAGNIVNILVSNYRIDRNLAQPNQRPTGGQLYQQHYVDSGRDPSQMTDDWSVQNYFGGKNPATLYNNNRVTQRGLVQELPVNGRLSPRQRDYSSSSGGVSLTINNLPFTVQSVETRRVAEGGNLSSMLPPTTGQVSYNMNGSSCTITDAGASEYTVTLYRLTLSNDPPGQNPNNPNNPNQNPNNPNNPNQPPAQPNNGSFQVVQRLLRGQLDTSMLFLSTNMPDNFPIQSGNLYRLFLALPANVAGPTGPVRPFISRLSGIWLPPPFMVVSQPYLGPNVSTATFIVQATESGNFRDLVSGPSRGSVLVFGKIDFLTTPLTITFSAAN